MIAYAMGGRAAEKIVFNELTTGASNDIERATDLARKMVCDFGMSEKLGPLKYGSKQEEVFLGKDISHSKNYSESTQILIDEEIKKIVGGGMDNAERILNTNIEKLHRLSLILKLHRLSLILLERETLDSEEIDMVLRGETLPPVVNDDDIQKVVNLKDNGKEKKSKEDKSFNPGEIALAN